MSTSSDMHLCVLYMCIICVCSWLHRLRLRRRGEFACRHGVVCAKRQVEVAKCPFPHRKDYTSTSMVALLALIWLWTNRTASPGHGTQPESTAAPRHLSPSASELVSATAQPSARATPQNASDCIRSPLQRCRCLAAARAQHASRPGGLHAFAIQHGGSSRAAAAAAQSSRLVHSTSDGRDGRDRTAPGSRSAATDRWFSHFLNRFIHV